MKLPLISTLIYNLAKIDTAANINAIFDPSTTSKVTAILNKRHYQSIT